MPTKPTDAPIDFEQSVVHNHNIRSLSAIRTIIISITIIMFIFGVTMVFSASTVEQLEQDQNMFQTAIQQLIYGVIGFGALIFLAGMPTFIYEKIAGIAVIICDGLILLTFFVGETVNGNKNWLKIIPGLPAIQPSEFAKLAFCIFVGIQMAYIHKNADKLSSEIVRKRIISTAVWILFGLLLIFLEKDLGTAMVIGVMLLGELFLAGIKLRWFILVAALAVFGASMGLTMSENRMSRMMATYMGCDDSDRAICYQQDHSLQAFATGGLFGKGPGASREKWMYLPEAHTDFIFAIIGEEWGFFGAITIIICFILLITMLVLVMLRTDDLSKKYITGGILSWLIAQTAFNIGATLGLLPVIGVPLPLISYGGTALISTLMAIGVALSFTNNKTVQKLSTPTARKMKTVYAACDNVIMRP